jgi:hypothetical protein
MRTKMKKKMSNSLTYLICVSSYLYTSSYCFALPCSGFVVLVGFFTAGYPSCQPSPLPIYPDITNTLAYAPLRLDTIVIIVIKLTTVVAVKYITQNWDGYKGLHCL